MSPACRTGAGSSLSLAGHPLHVTQGHPLPLGANLTPSGVNFALICRHATAIRLVLSEPHDPEALTEIALDPRRDRTGEHWHIRVDGLPGEFCYGYRVDGPSGSGHRFDPSLVLLDPASDALSCGRHRDRSGRAEPSRGAVYSEVGRSLSARALAKRRLLSSWTSRRSSPSKAARASSKARYAGQASAGAV